MATPWQQVLAQLGSINNPQEPFSYVVEGDRIVGSWDVAKIASLGIDGANTFDKAYRIDVRPVADGKFDYTEQGREREAEAGLGGASGGISGFKGKSKSFSFGKEMGPGADPNANWSFSTDRIKDPLFGYLKHHGWEPKGFFGRLFG